MTRLENLIDKAERAGLAVYTYSPGDGVTRYRFSRETNSDYFACRAVYTALGLKEAHCFADGAVVGATSWMP